MKNKLLSVLLICTMLMLAACSSSDDASKTEASDKEKSDEGNAKNAVEEVDLYNQDNIEITAKLTATLDSGWKLILTVDNKSDKNISVGITELKANDVLVDGCDLKGGLDASGTPDLQAMRETGFLITDIAAGTTQTAEDVTYALDKEYLEGDDITALEKISITLGIFDTDTNELLSQSERVKIQLQ